ncbi:MAG: ATP-dependent zinc protease [Candidatus Eisenbacteria bacterium]|uniref:ATP-dependent zinc protease n=1 Tax=Eiseniibacteriota bacterium TaxID=2212470 RepID=A0A956NF54_UNCEI|nr:ATP-dependent zinc protease [Candidatus Eisenbacteria bacterium]MCB9465526.1 ATP-dependent zinc protease [Candidatus Eisenbacteria bacterium]
MKHDRSKPRLVAGWREWVALPHLGIESVKAKLDVGARTSALHAYDIEPFDEEGQERVRFKVHPVQGRDDIEVACVAPLVGRRSVKNSGGIVEARWVVRTSLRVGDQEWPIDITLTNRKRMRFRMLLGRAAMRGHLLVNPGRSFLIPLENS